MKNIWKWIALGVAFFLAGFCVALPLFGIFGGMPARFLSGPGMMYQLPMMGGGWGGGAMVGLAMLVIRCLLPILIVAGFIVLIVLLVRKSSKGASPAESAPPPTGKVCSACGKPVEAGWVACPHCGQKV
jgi:hypothetical protein